MAAFAPLQVGIRNAAFAEILADRRRAHGERYASKTIRDDYRGTSKQFTMEEAFNLLILETAPRSLGRHRRTIIG